MTTFEKRIDVTNINDAYYPVALVHGGLTSASTNNGKLQAYIREVWLGP